MNAIKSVSLTLAIALLTPVPGHAHFTTEMGSFYGGMLHPVTDAMMILPILGFGIWAAQQDTCQAGKMILYYTLVLPAGVLAGLNFPGPIQPIPLCSILLTGILIYREFRPPVSLAAFFPVLLSLGTGYMNGTDAGSNIDRPWLYISGFSLGAGLMVFYTTGFLLSLKHAWKSTAIRFTGGILTGGSILMFITREWI